MANAENLAPEIDEIVEEEVYSELQEDNLAQLQNESDKPLKTQRPLKRLIIALIVVTVGLLITVLAGVIAPQRDIATVNPDRVDPINNGSLVHMTGDLSQERFSDPIFNVGFEGLALERIVEMYQQPEDGESKPIWSEDVIGLNAPRKMYFSSQKWETEEIKVGVFSLSPGLTKLLGGHQELPLTDEDLVRLNPHGQKAFKVVNGQFYFGLDPQNPDIGDLRISFRTLKSGPVSILAEQNGNQLVAFRGEDSVIEKLKFGSHTPASLLGETSLGGNPSTIWMIRSAGIFVLIVGIFTAMVRVSRPSEKLAKKKKGKLKTKKAKVAAVAKEEEKEDSGNDDFMTEIHEPIAEPELPKELLEKALQAKKEARHLDYDGTVLPASSPIDTGPFDPLDGPEQPALEELSLQQHDNTLLPTDSPTHTPPSLRKPSFEPIDFDEQPTVSEVISSEAHRNTDTPQPTKPTSTDYSNTQAPQSNNPSSRPYTPSRGASGATSFAPLPEFELSSDPNIFPSQVEIVGPDTLVRRPLTPDEESYESRSEYSQAIAELGTSSLDTMIDAPEEPAFGPPNLNLPDFIEKQEKSPSDDIYQGMGMDTSIGIDAPELLRKSAPKEESLPPPPATDGHVEVSSFATESSEADYSIPPAIFEESAHMDIPELSELAGTDYASTASTTFSEPDVLDQSLSPAFEPQADVSIPEPLSAGEHVGFIPPNDDDAPLFEAPDDEPFSPFEIDTEEGEEDSEHEAFDPTPQL